MILEYLVGYSVYYIAQIGDLRLAATRQIPVLHESYKRGNALASVYWEDRLVVGNKKFDKNALAVAHKTLPIGTKLQVTNPYNQKSVTVVVNDRGPFIKGRDIDLTPKVSKELDCCENGKGLGRLLIEVKPKDSAK